MLKSNIHDGTCSWKKIDSLEVAEREGFAAYLDDDMMEYHLWVVIVDSKIRGRIARVAYYLTRLMSCLSSKYLYTI